MVQHSLMIRLPRAFDSQVPDTDIGIGNKEIVVVSSFILPGVGLPGAADRKVRKVPQVKMIANQNNR